jgi:hypothetical protein
MSIWYILPRSGTLCYGKSGNPGLTLSQLFFVSFWHLDQSPFFVLCENWQSVTEASKNIFYNPKKYFLQSRELFSTMINPRNFFTMTPSWCRFSQVYIGTKESFRIIELFGLRPQNDMVCNEWNLCLMAWNLIDQVVRQRLVRDSTRGDQIWHFFASRRPFSLASFSKKLPKLLGNRFQR